MISAAIDTLLALALFVVWLLAMVLVLDTRLEWEWVR